MKDFQMLYYALHTLVEELLHDFQTESKQVVTNNLFMHNEMKGLSKKLESFIAFNKLFLKL